MDIAILLPAYNEEKTIRKVIKDFEKELPEAKIYVCNNSSTDKTEELAKSLNVNVLNEHKQGKGNCVRKMFREIEADIYILVDSDDTYNANEVHKLIQPIINGDASMVVGNRLGKGEYENNNPRKYHFFGNKLISRIVSKIYKTDIQDIMSGYRAMTYEFVKTVPILSSNFEVETEMALFCLDKKFKYKEIDISYKERPEGSYSKLNTFKDGYAIILTILNIYKTYKPFSFFSKIALFIFCFGIFFGSFPTYEYFSSGYITKVPLTVLTAILILSSAILFAIAIILDVCVNINRQNTEMYIKNIKRNIK